MSFSVFEAVTIRVSGKLFPGGKSACRHNYSPHRGYPAILADSPAAAARSDCAMAQF